VHLVGSVHANWLLIILSCMFMKGKYVMWNDGGFPEKLKGTRNSWWFKYFRKHVAAAFTSGYRGHIFSSRLGIPEKRIYNAYFSHDVDNYSTFYYTNRITSRRKIRKRLALGLDQFVILCISRFLNWKRLVDLADALVLLEQRHSSLANKICLILIGDGDDRAHEFKLNRLNRIQVHHEKKVSYEIIKEWYCAADIFVFPSEGDIWGLTVNEALSLGLPVICTTAIGAAELLKNGVNGYLVKSRSPDKLMACIVTLATNSKLLMRMQRNAIKIHKTWNSNLAISELEKLITDITIIH